MSFHGLITLHCLYYHNLFTHLLRNTLLLPSFGNCESSYYKHPFPRVCPSSCPLHWWCHPTISCSVALFCLQSFPASKSFPMSQLFASGGQRIGASASVLPMSIQGWFPLDWLVWSPCSPRDSQESPPAPQFEGINSLVLCLLYDSALTSIHDYWKDDSHDYMDLCQQSDVFAF